MMVNMKNLFLPAGGYNHGRPMADIVMLGLQKIKTTQKKNDYLLARIAWAKLILIERKKT